MINPFLQIKRVLLLILVFLLTLYSLMLLASCGKKTPAFHNNFSGNHNANIAGDTVSAIDKNIWVIYQDKHRNYWFGSNGKGVFRYDGKTIIRFTTQNGLCNDQIRGIKEDDSGNIFFATCNGISKFDGQKFSTLPVIESNVWEAKPNDIWFGSMGMKGGNGVYRYDGKNLFHLKFPKHYMEDGFYAVNGKRPWSPYETYSIYKDSKNNMWFGTACFGICRFDGKTLSWMYEKHLTETPEGGSFGIRSIIEDKEGKFWFCNTRYRYDISPNDSSINGHHLISFKKENGIDSLQLKNNNDHIYFQYIIEDNNGDLWMSTYTGGIWRYDGNNITHYSLKTGIEDIKIISIYKDNYGNLWLGTQEEGIYKFNGKAFEKFLNAQ